MHRKSNPNIELLELVVSQLGTLIDEMVFVGGCATGLLLTDTAAPPIRPTQDVDVLTEVATMGEYYQLMDKLKEHGFSEGQDNDDHICRWTAPGMLLDVMPTNPEILGFGNEWYEQALHNAAPIELPSGTQIAVVTSPYFLATKLAAFDDRGNGDYVLSHDIEDIVAVLDGRPEIIEEVSQCEQSLREHLRARFSDLLKESDFIEALPGHLPTDDASQARLPLITDRMKMIGNVT
jgi:predicted nucleotidyltransferase